MQHERMSGSTGTTATFVRDPTVPLSKVNARMRTLGKLDPNLLLAVIDTEYMVNGFKSLITCKTNGGRQFDRERNSTDNLRLNLNRPKRLR